MTITRRHILQAGAAGVSLVALGRFHVSEAGEAAGAGAYADAWPVLDRFVEQSQFIIITHNKRTIAKADVLTA